MAKFKNKDRSADRAQNTDRKGTSDAIRPNGHRKIDRLKPRDNKVISTCENYGEN